MPGRSKILLLFLPIYILAMFYPQAVFAQDEPPSSTSITPSLTDTVSNNQTPSTSGGISEPKDGAILQGSVVFSGTAAAGWLLEFSYTNNSADTWFPLAQSKSPVTNGTLATWDTSNLTDGLYYVRLSVNTDTKQEYLVKIQVSNYTTRATETPTLSLTLTPSPAFTLTDISKPENILTETSTPIFTSVPSVEPVDLAAMTQTPVAIGHPTPGKNPASLNSGDILISLGKGSLVSALLFSIAGFLYFLRHK